MNGLVDLTAGKTLKNTGEDGLQWSSTLSENSGLAYNMLENSTNVFPSDSDNALNVTSVR